MTPPAKVCIVKLGAIGDVVNSLPLLHRLRAAWPACHITWVIAPLAHGLVGGIEGVDEFLVLDLKRKGELPAFLRELRRRRFDLVIDLQRLMKSGLLSWLSGAPRRLGFDRARSKEFSWLFSNERITPNSAAGVTVAQYLEFADHLGLEQTPPEWKLPIEAWTSEAPRLCLNLGASKEANLWPEASWTELIRQAATWLGPTNIALSGGPGDRDAAERVLADAPTGIVDTVGRLSLKQSAGLLAASELVVACDTGPMHIAVAVGTPLVALFGAADPERTGPFGQPEAVLYRPAPCSPCRKRECFVDGHPCMTELSVELVMERLRAHLER